MGCNSKLRLGRKLINRAAEAPKRRTYRVKVPAGRAGCPSKGTLARYVRRLGVPQGFGQNGHLPRQESLKYRHIPALSFLAPGRFDSNLGGAVYEFTA